jgi:hypothetical protein
MTLARAEHLHALQEILTLDANACTVEVCIAALQPGETMPDFQRLRLAESLKKDFRDIVSAFILESYKELQLHNLQLVEFEVASKPERYQIEHLDLAKRPYNNITEQIRPLGSLYGLDIFKEETPFTTNMRFYVVVLQPPHGQPVYFYRHYSPKKMLREAAPLAIARILGTDEFEEITTPVFLFDEHVDCFSRGTSMFIMAKTHFYYMFRILDELIASARDILNRIHSRVPIENFDTFASSCMKNKLKMEKLTSIARRPYLDRLTVADMEPVIQRHRLHIKIVKINGQDMLHFDRNYPWDILKLLDDDYLTSIMTGQSYEVDAKRNP